MSLSHSIDVVAQSEGLDRMDVIGQLEFAIQQAASAAFGREFTAQYDEATCVVSLRQTVRVVDEVAAERALNEMDLATAAAEFDGEVGDEFDIEVFYRDEDAEAARMASETYAMLPRFEELAKGFPCPSSPPWMSAVWPHRRLPWRWDLPVALPSLDDALAVLKRCLSESAHAVDHAGAPRSALEELRALGPVTRGLVALHARLGASREGGSLAMNGANLASPESAMQGRELLAQLAAEGSLEGGAEAWSLAWLPVFGEPFQGTAYCLRLEDGPDGEAGEIASWGPVGARTIEAPSLGAWLGVIALGVEFGLVGYHGEMGICAVGPEQLEGFRQLQRRVLPGYPRPMGA